MQISIKKGDLTSMNQFVENLKLSGAKLNRSRYRVLKLINSKIEELNADRIELSKPFASLDNSGNPVIENGSLSIPTEKQAAFNDEQLKLFNENALITIDDYINEITEFYNGLIKYNETLQGSDAIAYGKLLENLENAGIKEVVEKEGEQKHGFIN